MIRWQDCCLRFYEISRPLTNAGRHGAEPRRPAAANYRQPPDEYRRTLPDFYRFDDRGCILFRDYADYAALTASFYNKAAQVSIYACASLMQGNLKRRRDAHQMRSLMRQ